jgi:hypothetical protein
VALVAVTVKMDELPAVTAVGFAAIVTVGAGFAATVTVAVAEVFPPAPLAVAVYVVVTGGETDCVPPLADREYELPSLPEIVTWVALVAATVKTDEAPAVIEAGFATMLTPGAAGAATVRLMVVYDAPPHLSHSSTTVCSAPGLSVIWVFSFAAFTT